MGKPTHLSEADIAEFGRELDAVRDEVMNDLGERDARYIHNILATQRYSEVVGRAMLMAGFLPPAWLGGVGLLSLSKILENMEIGHNVMHGQWDWMRDPHIHSSSWEWDNAAPAAMWKHSHNELHHTYTNVIGQDEDLGYGILRVDADQPWSPIYLGQPLWNLLNALVFQYSIAFYDLNLVAYLSDPEARTPEARERFRRDAPQVARKIGRHVLRDYVLHPLLSGPSWLTTITANLTALLAEPDDG